MVKDKAYYEKWNKERYRQKRRVDYHMRQAERCKKICRVTKNSVGLYRLLNNWAEKKHKKHCDLGTEIAIKEIAKCVEEFYYLNDIFTEKEP